LNYLNLLEAMTIPTNLKEITICLVKVKMVINPVDLVMTTEVVVPMAVEMVVVINSEE
jgi:hypothetical protein